MTDIHSLLALAAELRAQGQTCEAVATRVGRDPATCRGGSRAAGCYAIRMPPSEFAGMSRLVIALWLLSTVARAEPAAAADHGTTDPRLQGLRTPDGFRLEIIAAVPQLRAPVDLAFGPDGSLFVLEHRPDPAAVPVTETVTYRDGTRRTIPIIRKSVRDVIRVRRLDPAAGTFGEPRVIVEDDEPTSLLVHDGHLYTTGRGAVRRWKLADVLAGKNPTAKPEVIVRGLHPGQAGVSPGPDGDLYLTTGPDADVEGADGKRLRVRPGGAVLRCRPDGSGFREFATGLLAPGRDVAFDPRGRAFVRDAGRPVRIREASDHSDDGRDNVAPEWPTSLRVYADTQLPAAYRGLLGTRGRTVTVSTPDGRRTTELLSCREPAFRPTAVAVGPDGSVYVADRRDDGGRLYRLTWSGGPVPGADEPEAAIPPRPLDTWSKLQTAGRDDLRSALASPDAFIRDRAARVLLARARSQPDTAESIGIEFRNAVADVGRSAETRLAALHGLFARWNDDARTTTIELLTDAEADVRRMAATGLGDHAVASDADASAALERLLDDSNPDVRRAAALAIGTINAPSAAEALVIAYAADDGRDAALTEGYIRGIERTGRAGLSRVVDLARSGTERGRAKAVDLFLHARTPAAAELLSELIAYPHLTPDQRAALIRSYANSPPTPPPPLQPLVEYLARNPDQSGEVVTAALAVLGDNGQLKSAAGTAFVKAIVQTGSPAARLAALRAIEKHPVPDTAAALVADLADRDRPPAERVALLRAIRSVKAPGAAAVLPALIGGDTPAAVKAEALATLAVLAPDAARAPAAAALDEPDLRAAAVRALGATAAGARLAGDRFVAGKLPPELLADVADGLRAQVAAHPDLAPLYRAVLRTGLLGTAPGEADAVRRRVIAEGDPLRGRELFLANPALGCAGCHRIEGVGGTFGPDLTGLWDRATIGQIAEAIIDPSAKVHAGFEAFEVTTTGGQKHLGRTIRDGAEAVVIRPADGPDVRVAKDEVKELRRLKSSLMPDRLVTGLTVPDLLHLLAFLKSRQAQEGLRGTVTAFQVAGPFAADRVPTFDVTTGAGPTWRPATAGPGGPRVGTDGYGLARTYVLAAQEQTVAATWEPAGAVVWVNGRRVGRGPVRLRAGWNTVVVWAAGADGPVRLRLPGSDLTVTAAPPAGG